LLRDNLWRNEVISVCCFRAAHDRAALKFQLFQLSHHIQTAGGLGPESLRLLGCIPEC
jgi:hypothetical protein